MSDLPSQDQMNLAKKATRMIELQQLNNECDKRLGRDTSPLFTEKNLSKSTLQALEQTEVKPAVESKLIYHLPQGMEKKLENFDKSIHDTAPAPHYKGPVDPVTKLENWYRALGTPKRIVDFEIAELKKQLEAKK